jgi:hypothetical protein
MYNDPAWQQNAMDAGETSPDTIEQRLQNMPVPGVGPSPSGPQGEEPPPYEGPDFDFRTAPSGGLPDGPPPGLVTEPGETRRPAEVAMEGASSFGKPSGQMEEQVALGNNTPSSKKPGTPRPFGEQLDVAQTAWAKLQAIPPEQRTAQQRRRLGILESNMREQAGATGRTSADVLEKAKAMGFNENTPAVQAALKRQANFEAQAKAGKNPQNTFKAEGSEDIGKQWMAQASQKADKQLAAQQAQQDYMGPPKPASNVPGVTQVPGNVRNDFAAKWRAPESNQPAQDRPKSYSYTGKLVPGMAGYTPPPAEVPGISQKPPPIGVADTGMGQFLSRNPAPGISQKPPLNVAARTPAPSYPTGPNPNPQQVSSQLLNHVRGLEPTAPTVLQRQPASPPPVVPEVPGVMQNVQGPNAHFMGGADIPSGGTGVNAPLGTPQVAAAPANPGGTQFRSPQPQLSGGAPTVPGLAKPGAPPKYSASMQAPKAPSFVAGA